MLLLFFGSDLAEGLVGWEGNSMLVLNRKSDQEILVGGNIRVKVLSVKGNTVRLGIEAPGEVSILRGELTLADGQCQDQPRKPIAADISTSDMPTPQCDVPFCS